MAHAVLIERERWNWLPLALFALIVLFLAQVNNWDLLDRLFLAIAGLLAVAYGWTWLGLRDLYVTRESRTDRAQIGQPVAERLRIENRGCWGKLWVEAHDLSTLPGHDASRVVSLHGRSSARWQVSSICTRRGRFTLGPLVLRAGDPFGLFARRRLIQGGQELLVYPATVDVGAFVLPTGELAGGSNTQGRTHQITPNAAGVRQYLPGDSFNRISWPTTARTGHLMVKEFELDPAADTWIVLDMDGASHVISSDLPQRDDDHLGAVLEYSTEELAVTVAASLSRHFLQQNRAVGLVATGQRHEFLPTDRGSRQLLKVLESLAVIRAEGRQPLAEVLTAEGGRFGRHSTLVVITASTDDRIVAALGMLLARGVKAVAIVIEPSTFGAPESSLLLVSGLAAINVPTYLLKRGDDIGRALAHGTVFSTSRL